MHASETPVLLGRVCRGWRKIAYATPELWASIHLVAPPVDFSESAISPGDIRLMAMEEWLARSAVCPLSISIWVSHEAWGAAAAAAASPFVEAILPLSSRWKHIELRVPSDSLDSFHYLQATDVPLLQTLSITNGGSLARDDWYAFILLHLHKRKYNLIQVWQPALSSTCSSASHPLIDARWERQPSAVSLGAAHVPFIMSNARIFRFRRRDDGENTLPMLKPANMYPPLPVFPA
jgi:hypothetical protein